MNNPEKRDSRTGYIFLLIFSFLALGILAGGYFAFQNYQKNYRTGVEQQLAAVADLKVDQIERWRKERLGDGQIFYRNEVFSAAVKRYVQNRNDRSAKQEILTWAGQVQNAGNYDLMMLLDAQFNTLLVFPENKERARLVIDQNNTEILRSGNIAFQDFYLNDQDRHIYLKILVPIMEDRSAKRLIAVLALRISPEEYLFPLIKKWPVPSRTSETLIIRRDGNDALFLNDPRFLTDAALKLRIPLERKDVVSVKAVLGEEGIVEGVDYRGVPVIADVRAVPNSGWFLVARMDREEMNTPLKERLWSIILLVIILITGAGVSVGFVWHRQRSRFYREQYKSGEAVQNSEIKYRRLFEAARDGIIILDAGTGMVADVNPYMIEMLGYTREQFLGKKIWDLGSFKDIIANQEKFLELQSKEYVRYEDLPLETIAGQKINVEFVSNVYLVDHHKVIQCNIRDITERKRTKGALTQEQNLLKAFMDNIPDNIYFKDRESRFIRSSKAQAQAFGLSDPAQIIGKTDFDFFTDEHARPAYEAEQEIIKTGRPIVGLEEKETWLDGRVTWVSTTKVPLYDANGKIVGTFGISRDVTKQKHTEEALIYERNLLNAFMDNIPDNIYFKDLKSRFIKMSKAQAHGFGISDPAQIVGKTDFDFFTDEHARPAYEAEQEIIKTGRPIVGLEEKETWPDGRVTWVSTTKLPLYDNNGKIVGTFGISRSITEHKLIEEELRKNEERFRKIFEESQIGMTILEPDFRYGKVNPVFCSMVGYTAKELASMTFVDITHPDDIGRGIENMRKLEHGEIPFFKTEKRFIHKTGEIVWANMVVSVVRNNDGSLLYYLGMIENITERKRVEDAARESEEKFRMIFENVFDGISIYTEDPDPLKRKLIECNDRYAAMSGRKREELFQYSNTKELQITLEEKANFNRIESLARGEAYRGSFSWIRPDGKDNIIEYVGVPVTWHGRSFSIGIDRDITERMRAEEESRETRDYLENILSFANAPIIVWDSELRVTRFNLAFEKLSGYTMYDIIGKHPQLLFPAHMKDALSAIIHQTSQGDQLVSMEMPIQCKNGNIRTVLWNSANIYTSDGRSIIATIAHGMDVTERITAEKALKESTRKIETIVNNLTGVVYQCLNDPEWTMQYISDGIFELSGYPAEEFIGNRIRSYNSIIAEADRNRVWGEIQKALANNQSYALEYRLHTAARDIKFIWERGKGIYENGILVSLEGYITDITIRKQAEEALQESEERYRLLVEFSPNAIAVYSDGVFVFVNPAAVKLFGAQDESQLIGKLFLDVVHPQSKEFVAQRMHIGLKEGNPLPVAEEKLIKIDGSVIDVEVSEIPFVFGAKSAMQAIMHDITQRKLLQNQLMQTQKVQSIGTLAGGIAHDFNNILGIILAFTSVLERSKADEEKILKSTTAITQAVGRGAALVRQILTFARQTGISMKPLSIPGLVRELVPMLKETFPKLIEFQTDVEKDIPFINADHAQMHQVLLNLCVNARDAMPKGGTISIEVKKVASETLLKQFPKADKCRYISINVSDTGIGMDEATSSRIFDPFFTTKEQDKGTGLGLSVVYGVIQEHHGFISVESKVGEGTTFHLYLPVPQEGGKILDVEKIKTGAAQGGSETILFVEDEMLLRDIVQSCLKSNGYNVFVAADGREAVEIYKKQYKNISLVLTDMGLPKLSGIDVYAMLKEMNPAVAVIFASGFISLETRSELLKEGAKGFILKPYNLNEVLRIVREALDENKK